MSPPSPLDSPRFFDDEAHSEWALGGKTATGPRTHFSNCKAYARIDPGDAWVPPAEDDTDRAIGIEIVRGANGPGDHGWSVVIDGLRHPLQRRGGVDEEGVPFAFTLPSGVPYAPLTPTTRVRPVAVAVRLEAEALEPQSVQVIVDQVLNTTELAGQRNSGGDEPPLQTGPAQNLTPYRVDDVSATAVVLAYPFWAPAQSTIGIMDVKPFLRHQEVEDSINAHNLWQTWRNINGAKAYQAAKAAMERLEKEGDVGDVLNDVFTAMKSIGRLAGISGQLAKLSKNSSAATRRKLIGNLSIPPPTPFPPKWPPAPPSADAATSTSIGGGKASAARELAILFEQLSQTCEERVEEANVAGQKLGLQKHLQLMRVAMDINGDSKLKTFFDALMSTDPFPAAQLFLDRARVAEDNVFRRQYAVNRALYPKRLDSVSEARAPPAAEPDCSPSARRSVDFIPPDKLEGLTNEQRDKLSDRIGKTAKEKLDNEMEHGSTTPRGVIKGVVGDSAPYVFTYDRLSLETLKKTTIRMRIRVVVREFDGSLVEFEFESAEAEGIVAHAVYAQLPMDLAALDFHAKNFVDCMFRTHACVDESWRDARDWLTNTIRPWVQSKYYRKKRRLRTLQGKDMWQLYSYLPQKALEGALGYGDKTADGPYLPLDPDRLEERVAELRMMVREIVPQWPPVDARQALAESVAAVSQQPAETPAEAGAEAGAEAEAPAVPTGLELKPEQIDRFRKSTKEQKEDQKEAATQQLLDLFERNANLATVEVEATKTMVALSVFNEARQAGMLTRRLPHIVSPNNVHVLFQMLANMDAPVEYIPSDAETRKHGSIQWTPRIKAAGGALVAAGGAAALYYGAPAAIAWMVMNNAVAASQQLMKENIDKVDKETISQEWGSMTGLGWQTAGKVAIVGSAAWTGNYVTAATTAFNLVQGIAPAWSSIGRQLGKKGIEGVKASDILPGLLRKDLEPFVINLASTVHAFATRRAVLKEQKEKQYKEHRKKIRGMPVASAIDAANSAFIQYQARRGERAKLLGEAYREKAIYNAATGVRFLFIEHYYADPQTAQAFDELNSLTGREARPWVPMPDSGAMSLSPPSEVAETLYAAEELRGMPLAKMAAFTAGAAPPLAVGTPGAIAAKAAHRELVQVVFRQRRDIRGEHLMQAPGDLVLQISKSTASILRSTYGASAGFTSVFGEDIMWSCARGGVAARLAVRHLPIFQQSEAAHEKDTTEKRGQDERLVDRRLGPSARGAPREYVATQLEGPSFWNRPRRVILEQFTELLVAEAVAFAKNGKDGSAFRAPSMQAVSVDAARRFARMSTLLEQRTDASREQKGRILFAAASSMAHAMQVSVHPENDVTTFAGGVLAVEVPKAALFQDQVDLHVPDVQPVKPSLVVAAWASKRIAPGESRARRVGGGAEEVTQLLSGLSVGCGQQGAQSDDGRRRDYYCPMGSLVEAFPGRVPFDVDLLEQRLVWMEPLARTGDLLVHAVTATPNDLHAKLPANQLFIDTIVMQGLGDKIVTDGHGVTGAARHPLVVSTEAGTIRLQLSNMHKSGAAEAPEDDSLPVASLLDVLMGFQELDVDISAVRQHTVLMRRIAYNAERLWFALSLASTNERAAGGLAVHVAAPLDAVAFAIATAMFVVGAGRAFSRTTLYVDNDADVAKRLVESVSAQAKEALRQGCKVCTLAEVAICAS